MCITYYSQCISVTGLLCNPLPVLHSSITPPLNINPRHNIIYGGRTLSWNIRKVKESNGMDWGNGGGRVFWTRTGVGLCVCSDCHVWHFKGALFSIGHNWGVLCSVFQFQVNLMVLLPPHCAILSFFCLFPVCLCLILCVCCGQHVYVLPDTPGCDPLCSRRSSLS